MMAEIDRHLRTGELGPVLDVGGIVRHRQRIGLIRALEKGLRRSSSPDISMSRDADRVSSSR